MSFRKEKKIRLSYGDFFKIQNEMINRGFIELHPTRIVNSLYFDNENLSFFVDSEEGVLPRKKIRVRWYDDDFNFTKETKISSIEGRFKSTKSSLDLTNLKDLYGSEFFDKSYGRLKPKLYVSYEREYLKLNTIRLTFDKNITYKFYKTNFEFKLRDNECVMEIKVSENCSDDYINKLIVYPTSRFSKYSRGVLFSLREY